jgi:hypothetical protein
MLYLKLENLALGPYRPKSGEYDRRDNATKRILMVTRVRHVSTPKECANIISVIFKAYCGLSTDPLAYLVRLRRPLNVRGGLLIAGAVGSPQCMHIL